MSSAYDIVMENRRELVRKVIDMMKQGYFFNAPEWDRAMLCPQNPLSKVRYRGGNRLRLMHTVVEKGYTDPRWATLNQYRKKGYYAKKGEQGILCEKWIFTKEEIIVNEGQEKEKIIVELERPQVSYFKVFNAQQIQDFPVYQEQRSSSKELEKLIDEMILSSECPVYELAQNRSYYSPSRDQIVLPLRETFKDMESFGKVVFHEMGHSTGHPSRLNRKMGGFFGSPDYSMEELRAELGAMFIESDLNIQLKTENYQDHSDYLKSWLEELEADPNELFRACADAEKIAEYLVGNYEKKYQIPRVLPEEIPDKKGIHKKEKSRTL